MKTLACLALCLIAASVQAADAANDRANAAVYKFESAVARDFSPIEKSLERWRVAKQRAAIKDMFDLMNKAEGDDALYIAYQILALAPYHKAARKVFTTAKVPAPFDEKGKRDP